MKPTSPKPNCSTRATSLLFLLGAMAVMFFLAFASSEGGIRSLLRASNLQRQAQAGELARSGIVFARLHAADLTTTGTVPMERRVGAGEFVVSVDKDQAGAMWLVSTGRVPAERPRATATVRVAIP